MIVAGIGYRTGTTAGALAGALAQLDRAPDALASLDRKAQGPLRAVADAAGLPLIPLTEAQIAGVPTPTHSPRIAARFATGSLAEACALVAAGAGARLILPRLIGPCGHVTIALAEGHSS